MSRIVPLALLVALVASGCLAATRSPPPASGPDAATPAPLRERVDLDAELSGCEHADMYIAVPASAVEPYVPDDFEVSATGSGSGGEPVTLVFVGLLRCERFAAAGVEGRGDWAWFDVAVVPKHESMRDASRTIYLLRLEHYPLAGAYTDALASLGDNHTIADAIEFRSDVTGAGFTISAGDVRFEGEAVSSGLAPSAPFGGIRIREFGLAEGGYTYVDITVAPQGPTIGAMPGTVATSPASVASKVLGERGTGTLVTAAFDFAEGKIGFIPTP